MTYQEFKEALEQHFIIAGRDVQGGFMFFLCLLPSGKVFDSDYPTNPTSSMVAAYNSSKHCLLEVIK